MNKIEEEQSLDLWLKYEPEIRRFCNIKLYRFPDEVDDVVSEIFTAFWTTCKDGKTINYPRQWLYTVARNYVNKAFKRIYKDQENIVGLSDKEYILPYTHDSLLEIEAKEYCEILIEKTEKLLTDDEKRIMDLYNKGMQLKEIAVIMGSTYPAIKQKHYRSVNKVKKIVEKLNK